jgi:hypothetical protein
LASWEALFKLVAYSKENGREVHIMSYLFILRGGYTGIQRCAHRVST